jgi:hypothetical protein
MMCRHRYERGQRELPPLLEALLPFIEEHAVPMPRNQHTAIAVLLRLARTGSEHLELIGAQQLVLERLICVLSRAEGV